MDSTATTDKWAVDEYGEYLRLLARLQLSPRLQVKVDASDVAQQALLQAHANRGQFRGQTEAEWRGWLRKILVNTVAAAERRYFTEARDVGRERSLEAELELSASRLECLLAADQTSPSQRAARAEDLLRLTHAISRLPKDQRQVVELHHLKGLPMSEVSRLMDRSRPAVVGLLFRGLKKLRGLLENQGENEA